MKIFFVLLILLTLPGVAKADTIEGPEGCTWNATVLKTEKSSMTVRVDEQYGSCVDAACPFDAEGKSYKLPAKKYKTGQAIKLWVDLDKNEKDRATTTIPKCWTQTVMSTTPDTYIPLIAPAAGSVTTDFADLSPVTSMPIPSVSEDMPPVEAFPASPVTKSPLSATPATRHPVTRP